MDPFRTLPAPVLEMILELVDDLPALHNLHDASPAVASLLHEDGVAPVIVEAIISRSIPWHTRHLIRRTALIRWNADDDNGGPPVPSSWDAFVGAYMWTEDDDSCRHEGDRHPLPKAIPPSIICRILSLASKVRRLAHRCIHEMIDRCMALEPSRLLDPTCQFRGHGGGSEPPGERFQPMDVGPPSWVEEQRVCRAIWRLIMFFELRDAVVGTRTKQARWCWPEKDVHRLRTLQYDDFWKPSVSACVHQMHELKTVAECLFSLTSPAATASTDRYPCFLSTTSTTTTTTTPAEKSSRVCSRCPPTFEPKPARERTWGQSEHDLNWSGSPGFHFVVLNLGGIPQSHLRYVELRVFRRFGFAIWDWRRMEALGFLKAPSGNRDEEEEGGEGESHPNAPVSESDAYFRWRSILTEAELEEVKRRRKHYWPSYDTIVPIPDLFG
ncbi:hypothetical protein VTN02DRAFT_5072 [Thermoascus thermophilus]